MTCPRGDPCCQGVSGLFLGSLSCIDCWLTAPASAILAYFDARAYAVTGPRHETRHPAVAAADDRKERLDDLLADLDRSEEVDALLADLRGSNEEG